MLVSSELPKKYDIDKFITHLKVGDLASLRNISVGEFLNLDEETQEHFHIHYGEIGVINWEDSQLVRIAYVRDMIEIDRNLVNKEWEDD